MADVSMKKAVVWTAIAKYTTAVLQLVFAAILSRLLTPEEFGIVAVINVFVVFFQLFCDMGFGTAVIQDRGLTEKQTNDIFSWSIYIGLSLQVLFIFASFPIAKFYEDALYIPLGIILSFSLFINALNMIPNAVMLKQKRFKSITFRTITASVIASLLTIFLAFKGFGVYALILQSLFTSLIVFIWNEVSVKLKVQIKPDISSIRRIWGYSIYQFLSQLLNYFNRNLDQLLIGKFFSKADLGQYNKSYHLMQMPISYIPGVVGPALHPLLAEHQNEPQYIFNNYLRILKILSLIGCFISVWLYYTGEELVLLLFGDQWNAAVIPFKILALSVWAQLGTNTIAPIYQSIGDTKLMFKSTLFTTVLVVSSIIGGCILGDIVTVSICVSAAYVINFFLTYYIMVSIGFKKNFWMFLKYFWQELLFFIVMMGVTLMPSYVINRPISLILKSLTLTLVYFILLVISKQYIHLLSLIPKRK